jgi:decaprenylphospho-beta-D-erythro-pentofuranosid-2-ulose 2-reductase
MTNDSLAGRGGLPAPDPRRPRTALVLGGGSDIAGAIVARLARQGLERAVLAARDPEAAVARLRELAPGVDAVGTRWDALEPERAGALLDEAEQALGRIDLVLCAVGALGHHAGVSMTAPEVDEMVRTNFAGPAAALAAAGRTLSRQGDGTIVVLSSVAGLRARRSNYVYGSTKAGLDLFAQGLGDALAPTGARVLLVRPGFVRSKMTTGLDPAPFSTEPDAVAEAVARALGTRREILSVPGVLAPLFAVLRATPRSLWRRIAADR